MIGICIICIICVLVAESSLVSESFLIRYGESDFFCFGILFLIQARNPCDFPRRSKVRPIRRASWNEQLSKACYIMLYLLYLLWEWKSYSLIVSFSLIHWPVVRSGFWGLTIHFSKLQFLSISQSTWPQPEGTLCSWPWQQGAKHRKALPASLAILPVFTLTNETSSMAGCKRCRMIYIYICNK